MGEMSVVLQLLQEWRTADRAAQALEMRLARASLQGEPALEGGTEAVLRLRVVADDLFAVAMDEAKQRAEARKR